MISIAMATYNGEQFLDEQLRSLNEQVTPPHEIVVCDDQSTDRTRDLLARFARKASFPVKLFTNDRRLGWRENFLRAARLCSSEYISFCDQDDIWLKEKLAVVEFTSEAKSMHALATWVPPHRRCGKRHHRRIGLGIPGATRGALEVQLWAHSGLSQVTSGVH